MRAGDRPRGGRVADRAPGGGRDAGRAADGPAGMSWKATILSLFPEMFPGPLGLSLAGRALAQGIWSFEAHDLRAHGLGRHRSVDDTPFGGGAGMVMRADVVEAALAAHVPAGDTRPLLYL